MFLSPPSLNQEVCEHCNLHKCLLPLPSSKAADWNCISWKTNNGRIEGYKGGACEIRSPKSFELLLNLLVCFIMYNIFRSVYTLSWLDVLFNCRHSCKYSRQ